MSTRSGVHFRRDGEEVDEDVLLPCEETLGDGSELRPDERDQEPCSEQRVPQPRGELLNNIEIRNIIGNEVGEQVNECMRELRDALHEDLKKELVAAMRLISPSIQPGTSQPVTSRQTELQPVSRVWKPRVFDGSADWRAYIRQFEAISLSNGWSDQQKAMGLAAALSGPALTALNEMPSQYVYDDLVAALEDRYGIHNQPELCLALLQNRSQLPSEDIATYHQEVKELARKAGLDSKRDGEVASYFFKGLRDPKLREWVTNVWPACSKTGLTDALVLTLRMQIAGKATSVRCATVDEELKVKTGQLYQVTQPPGPRLCWRCDSPDHVIRNCPMRRRQQRANSNQQASGNAKQSA
ncbi:hypothetical protein GE061_000405 [Apolygus lucorum]|uniref:CCHC-type domain-containing protein n=1 Tax=Apolygus lucorum TaxID=248454 RepID=A0A8S9Y492_APOLU|nr:hypothetical protein GE061_000405 [Apolygus lucorum]